MADTLTPALSHIIHAAQALYRRHGFATRGPFGDYPEHPHSVFMEKRLG